MQYKVLTNSFNSHKTLIIKLKNFNEILGLQVNDNLKMQNITSLKVIFSEKMKLFPVETSQFLFYPDSGEREKC